MSQLTFFDDAHRAAKEGTLVQEPGNVTPDTSAVRKTRGAFFTPPEMVSFVAAWATRGSRDVVLEPSCGEAAFLLGAAEQLRARGAATADLARQLHGVELHPPSATAAASALAERGFSATIHTADFFDHEPRPEYDAVIGNPPYIRYQQFAGKARAKGLEAALRHGVRLTGLSSSWAAFVVHASQFLKPDGRLGLVLPAELLSVNYAAQVRRFLLERFAKVRLVMFEELVFPGVLEEVVLLLAEGTGPSPCFEVHQARDLSALPIGDGPLWLGFTPERGGKWTPALLPAGAFDVFRQITSGPGFSPLIKWGETSLGAVTGNNRFFALTAQEAAANQIPKRELLPISPPGSRHLRGLTFSERAWEEQASEGAKCYLFAPEMHDPSAPALRYIKAGEAANVHKAYKCRNRRPWWRVPLVRLPDLLLTYMDNERPRLVWNEARAQYLNSLYGVTLRHGLRELGRDLLPMAVLNSVTLLAAEMVGRAYGGGMLKLEPSEADLWAVPSETVLRHRATALRSLRPQLSTALRNNDVAAAVKLVDREMLVKGLGMSTADIALLRAARESLFARRLTRGRGSRGKN